MYKSLLILAFFIPVLSHSAGLGRNLFKKEGSDSVANAQNKAPATPPSAPKRAPVVKPEITPVAKPRANSVAKPATKPDPAVPSSTIKP
jgi:hypothetical protein